MALNPRKNFDTGFNSPLNQSPIEIIGGGSKSDRETIQETLSQFCHARYPVYGKTLDQILGFVHIKDLYQALKAPETEYPLENMAIRPLPLLPATADLETVLKTMFQEKTHLVILLDELGGTAGLITVGDILSALMGPLDQQSWEEAEIQPQPDGSLWVAGTLLLEDLAEYLDCPLEHEDVETVSGLILDVLERPPKVGERIQYAGLHFQVLSILGHGVERCEVRQLETETQSE